MGIFIIFIGSEYVGGSFVDVFGDFVCWGLWLGFVGEVVGVVCFLVLVGFEYVLLFVVDYGGD